LTFGAGEFEGTLIVSVDVLMAAPKDELVLCCGGMRYVFEQEAGAWVFKDSRTVEY
jgi:hypothetical protein